MKRYFKKFGSVILTFSMLSPIVNTTILNQPIFAEGNKTMHDVKPLINLSNWCWIISTQMVLEDYLKQNGKLSEEETIYEKYGEKCIECMNRSTKSIEGFNELYNQKVRNQTEDKRHRDAAFLVYISSNKLESEDTFSVGDQTNIMSAIRTVLKVAGLQDNQVRFVHLHNVPSDIKILTLNYALGNGSAVVSHNPGHYKVLCGIENNNVLVQETGGAPAALNEIEGYLDYEDAFIFIDNNKDENIFSDNWVEINQDGELVYTDTELMNQNKENIYNKLKKLIEANNTYNESSFDNILCEKYDELITDDEFITLPCKVNPEKCDKFNDLLNKLSENLNNEINIDAINNETNIDDINNETNINDINDETNIDDINNEMTINDNAELLYDSLYSKFISDIDDIDDNLYEYYYINYIGVIGKEEYRDLLMNQSIDFESELFNRLYNEVFANNN